MKTVGQIEEAISTALSQFERQFWGHGPKSIRTHVVGEAAMVRVQFVSTPAEALLISNSQHCEVLAQSRRLALSSVREELCQLVSLAADAKVLRVFHDTDFGSATRMFVFEFERVVCRLQA